MRYSEFKTRDKAEYIAQRLLKRMDMSPHQMNNGWCWAFAKRLAKELPGSEVISTTHYEGVFPGHSVVLYRGKYYDAENPEGVENMIDLDYNKRMQAAKEGDPEAMATLDAVAEYDPRQKY